jgi:predicted nucleotidyltransferase
MCLEMNVRTGYPVAMGEGPGIQFADELRRRLRPFCQKHHIRRLEMFGSAARGQAGPRSDVDLLVTLDESVPVCAAALLEMAGEAEELVGAPVDFVLRSSLEKSPNRFARDHILSTAVCVYGS